MNKRLKQYLKESGYPEQKDKDLDKMGDPKQKINILNNLAQKLAKKAAEIYGKDMYVELGSETNLKKDGKIKIFTRS